MSDYWSGQINFSGLGSGTDFGAIIEATIAVEGYRKRQMENWKADWEAKVEALQDLNQAMRDLRDWLADFKSPSAFLVKTASSTNADAITATADAAAEEGTHVVVVDQLAQNDIWVNTASPITDLNAVVADTDASITIAYAGKAHSISVPAGTTAQGLMHLINSNPSLGGDVRAKLIFDGEAHYLQLRGMDLGADNTVRVTASTVSGFGPDDFECTQAAQNARLKVDGFPLAADKWIELDSNVADGVIEGVSLTLKDVTGPGGVRIGIATDTESVMQNVRDFVAKINEVRTTIQEMTKIDSSTGEGSVMTGNYGVQMVGRRMTDITSGQGLGFVYYDEKTRQGDPFSSLSHLGILTDANDHSSTHGLLLLDEEIFAEALAKDPMAVAQFFAADFIGESESPEVSFLSLVDGMTKAGRHEITYTVQGGEIVSAFINGQEASISGWEITGKYGTTASGMAVLAEQRTDGTHSAVVTVKQGKILQLAEALADITNSETGTLKVIENNYKDIISGLETKIAWEEARLERKERTLRDQYARLETTLSHYNSLQAQLESQLAQLTTS